MALGYFSFVPLDKGDVAVFGDRGISGDGDSISLKVNCIGFSELHSVSSLPGACACIIFGINLDGFAIDG